MRLNFKTIKNLDVETESGVKLGRVYDLILQTEGQSILQYKVRSSFLSSDEYLISRDQVVKFTDKKMVVEDDISKTEENVKDNREIEQSPEPVVMRSNE